jgi:uncharacterized protein YfaT (DUF1175 family)
MAQESNRGTLAGLSEAFAIMSKYSSDTYNFCADHDEFFAGIDIDMEKVSAQDMERFKDLGWEPDEDNGGFYRFL